MASMYNKFVLIAVFLFTIFTSMTIFAQSQQCRSLFQSSHAVFVLDQAQPTESKLTGVAVINPTKLTWTSATETETTRGNSLNEPTITFTAKESVEASVVFESHNGNRLFNLDSLDRKSPDETNGQIISVKGFVTSVNFKIYSEVPATLGLGFFSSGKQYQLEVKHQGKGLQIFSVPNDDIKSIRKTNPNQNGVKFFAKSKSQGKFSLSFVGPIIFEKNPKDELVFERLVTRISMRPPENTRNPKDWAERTLKLLLKNLFDPEAINYALNVVNNPRLLRSFLVENDMSLVYLEKKLDLSSYNGFFGPETRIPFNGIPIETKTFAREHGTKSHLYQLIAATYKTTNKEKASIIHVYNSAIHAASVSLWQVWDVLFDGPGNRLPSTPRFWRDLEKI